MFRVRVQITGPAGSPWLATHYFLPSAGMTPDEAVAATGSFWNDCRVYMTTGATIASEAEVASVDALTGEVTGIDQTTPFSVTGASSADPLPPTVQGVVRWRTGTFVGGREIRGRTFIPGLTEAYSTNGVPTAGFLSGVQTAAAGLIADANSDLCIWSRAHQNDPLAVTASVWNQFGVLRSRRD